MSSSALKSRIHGLPAKATELVRSMGLRMGEIEIERDGWGTEERAGIVDGTRARETEVEPAAAASRMELGMELVPFALPVVMTGLRAADCFP